MADRASIASALDNAPPWAVPVALGVAVGGVILLVRRARPTETVAAPVAPVVAAAPAAPAPTGYEGQYVNPDAILSQAGANTQAEIARLQALIDERLSKSNADITERFGSIGTGIAEIAGKQAASTADLQRQLAALQESLNRPVVAPVVPPTAPTVNAPTGQTGPLTAADWQEYAANTIHLMSMFDGNRPQRLAAGTPLVIYRNATDPPLRARLILPVAYNNGHSSWRGEFLAKITEPPLARAARYAADTMRQNPGGNADTAFRAAIVRVGNQIKATPGATLWDGGFDYWSLGLQD